MAAADQVVVKLEAQIAEYKRRLGEAHTTFDRTTGQIENRGRAFSQRMRVHFGAFSLYAYGAIAAIPALLTAVIGKSLEYAGSLGEQAQQLGVTSKALQEYRFIASQVGISNEQMDKGLAFLTRSFGQAQDGAKKPIKALRDLGFTVKEIAQIIRLDAGDAIPLLAERLSKIPNAAERARIEIALFGRAGQQLDTLLAGGKSQIDSLREAVHRLGGVLSEKQIQEADATADKLAQLKLVLQAQIAGAVANNANAILRLANSLVTLVNIIGKASVAYDQFMQQFHQGQADFAQRSWGLPGWLGGGVGELVVPTPTGRLHQVTRHGEMIRDERNLANFYARRINKRNTDEVWERLRTNYIPGRGTGVSPNMPTITDKDTDVINNALKARGAQKDSGKSAAELAREAAERLRQFMDEADQLQMRANTAIAELVGTQEARADAERKNLTIQTGIDERRIRASEDYTKAQKETLIGELRLAAQKEAEIIDARAAQEAEKERGDVKLADIRNERDMLTAKEALATDRRERAEIEKRLLALAIEEERIQLRMILYSKTATDAQKTIALDRLNMLEDLQALGNASIDRQNQSPGQEYLQELRNNLANVHDTIQNLEVEQLKKLEDYLAGAAVKALGLKGALGQVAEQLIRIALQRHLIEPLANLLFGGPGGGFGSSGGFLGSIMGLFGGGNQGGGIFSAVGSAGAGFGGFGGMAAGGPIGAGSTRLVGERGPELFTPDVNGSIIPNHRLGGMRPGGGSSVVEVHIVGGEYFDARVANVSGPVAARVVRAAAPHLANISAARTVTALSRPKM